MSIRICDRNDTKMLAEIIRDANAPVARRFNLTPETAPKHPSNCTPDWILDDMDRGVVYFIATHLEEAIGCVGFERAPDGVCYMERLAVPPLLQGKGTGTILVNHFLDRARSQKMTHVSIGIIAEHHELRRWYEDRGFVLTETKKYDHLPFTVAFMRRSIL